MKHARVTMVLSTHDIERADDDDCTAFLDVVGAFEHTKPLAPQLAGTVPAFAANAVSADA